VNKIRQADLSALDVLADLFKTLGASENGTQKKRV
jgi:hypothetical protein